MADMADEICDEIKRQFNAANHFKALWLQANEELDAVKQQLAGAQARIAALTSAQPQRAQVIDDLCRVINIAETESLRRHNHMHDASEIINLLQKEKRA